ncbi:MAG: hypothetical protein ACOCU6_01560 [Nanoarchaeota archaeon]
MKWLFDTWTTPYRQKPIRWQLIISLLTLQLVFGVIYVISAINLFNGTTMISDRLSPDIEHLIIAVVVVITTINIIIELNTIKQD